MTTQELQDKLHMLKSQAYDAFAQMEFHQTHLRAINDEINKTNGELVASIVRDKEAGNSNQIPGAKAPKKGRKKEV